MGKMVSPLFLGCFLCELLILAVSDEEDVPLSGVRPQTSVTTKENLHFIIDSPKGVVQIGKCCILLRVNFSDSLMSRLLDEGDVSVKLQSSDTLVELHWSNLEKTDCFCSKIKVEIITSLEESRDSFKQDVIRKLLNGNTDYEQLCTIVNMLYDSFGAMLHRITGGCIELWIFHESKKQLDELKRRKTEVEDMLTVCLCEGSRDYTCCIQFHEDSSVIQGTIRGFTDGHGSQTFKNTPTSADDVIFYGKGREEIKRQSEEPISREEMQTYINIAVKRAIEGKSDSKWQAERAQQKHIQQQGGMMMIGREGIREIMMHQEIREPRNIFLVKKGQLRGIIWQQLNEMIRYYIVDKVKGKGKYITQEIEHLIASYHEMILGDIERSLSDELYLDIDRFIADINRSATALYGKLFVELERMSALDKDFLSETEINELNVRNKTAVDMCGRAIAACAMQVLSPPQPRQTSERQIKETGTHVPKKKADTVRPVDTETLRLRTERLLHRATPSQKDFLKQELDFDEINENPVSELPLGTRVEPKSKRALLQASLQRPGSEASARFKAAEETFGTVVNHTPEDEEQVIVHWDNPDESFLYHESNVRATMRPVPRKIMREQQVGIGVFVEKSDTWASEDLAGPVGVGTVIRTDLDTGRIQVKWQDGVPGWKRYRTAEDVETRQECFIDGEEQSSDE